MSEVLRKERPKKADVWRFFNVFEENSQETAQCKICGICLPRKRSTWNIRNHLNTEHPNAHLLQDAEDESEWFEISMDSEESETEHEENQTTSVTSPSTASNTIETTTSTTTTNNGLNGST
ncbi:uncharacterized protein LOC143265778 [Megachile rotundata]|uniref:uncharacterized protein LOC143265778 n=1 Tax=Megachile rotundata TaxID=143995 RepID=UPI003FD31DD8